MERKPVHMTVLCQILRNVDNVDFDKVNSKLCELSPDYSDDGDTRKIAYTINGKRYSIKTGRFIKKRLRGIIDLTDLEVQTIAAEINVELHGRIIEVHTGKKVYEKYKSLGINSCMANGKVPPHHFEVYEQNEAVVSLAVCYTSGGAARCLIWNAKDINNQSVTVYDRRYGSCEKAKSELLSWCKAQGYKDAYNCTDYYHVDVKAAYDKYPYIDTFCYMNETKTRLYNRQTNEVVWSARSTSGLVSKVNVKHERSMSSGRRIGAWTEPELQYNCDCEERGIEDQCLHEGYYVCDDCGEHIGEDDLHNSSFNYQVTMCASCFENHYEQCCSCGDWIEHHESLIAQDYIYRTDCYCESFTTCDCCDESVSNDYVVWVERDDRNMCEYCYDEHYHECACCNEHFHDEELTNVEFVHGEEQVCEECFNRHDYCDVCDEFMDDCVELTDNSIVCPKCHPDGPENPNQLGFKFGGKYWETDTEYRHHARLVKIVYPQGRLTHENACDLIAATMADLPELKLESKFGWKHSISNWSTTDMEIVKGPLDIMWPRDPDTDGMIRRGRLIAIPGGKERWIEYGKNVRWQNLAPPSVGTS